MNPNWWPPSRSVVAVVVMLLLFGGLAAWIIFRVVRFFGSFWGG